eukprot:GEMP01051347.1.p3 GENE.GEMP01051347.1~~GEMP01051347.1.p3  ORF type:complete len:232 (-),score=19.86 GEMP01051347.1:475-1170(-)
MRRKSQVSSFVQKNCRHRKTVHHGKYIVVFFVVVSAQKNARRRHHPPSFPTRTQKTVQHGGPLYSMFYFSYSPKKRVVIFLILLLLFRRGHKKRYIMEATVQHVFFSYSPENARRRLPHPPPFFSEEDTTKQYGMEATIQHVFVPYSPDNTRRRLPHPSPFRRGHTNSTPWRPQPSRTLRKKLLTQHFSNGSTTAGNGGFLRAHNLRRNMRRRCLSIPMAAAASTAMRISR